MVIPFFFIEHILDPLDHDKIGDGPEDGNDLLDAAGEGFEKLRCRSSSLGKSSLMFTNAPLMSAFE